ncbi:MAG: hypothetical protein HYV63_02495 [Candidatus Schekmanbacteria bacterium]|nr:hypothetical protein [Candidatus Schekmanbacteria bacterium]
MTATVRLLIAIPLLGATLDGSEPARAGTPPPAAWIDLHVEGSGGYCTGGSTFRNRRHPLAETRLPEPCPVPRGVRIPYYMHLSNKTGHRAMGTLSLEERRIRRDTGELPATYPRVVFTRGWIETIACSLTASTGERTPIDWRSFFERPMEIPEAYPDPNERGLSVPARFPIVIPGELTETLSPGHYVLECSAVWEDGNLVAGRDELDVRDRDTAEARALYAYDRGEASGNRWQPTPERLRWFLQAIEEDPATPGYYEEAALTAEVLRQCDLAADLVEKSLAALRKKVELGAYPYEPLQAPAGFPGLAFDPWAEFAEEEEIRKEHIEELRQKARE